MHRFATSTLIASMLVPGTAALADPMISPGITLIGTRGDGPMSGFSMGLETTVNVDDDFAELNVGGLVQLEFGFDGNVRLNLGGQVFGPAVGVELAYSLTFGDTPTSHGLMINPFIGIGYINAMQRNHLTAEGHTGGGGLSLKIPMVDGSPYMPIFIDD